jgi:hypothetical protein
MSVSIQTTCKTYRTRGGHGRPFVPAILGIDEQAMALKLGISSRHDFSPAGDRTAEVYVERRDGEWAICVSPDSDDAAVVVHIRDDGSVMVAESAVDPAGHAIPGGV